MVVQGFPTSKANLNFLSTCTYVCTCMVRYYLIPPPEEPAIELIHALCIYKKRLKSEKRICYNDVYTCSCHFVTFLLQHSLVCALEAGLVGRSSQMCVSSLTLCALELQATMTRLLPSVLFRLSQVAATLTMALPVLEFLSSLIPIPSLYSAFVEREYLSIVAIALPYTNHEK